MATRLADYLLYLAYLTKKLDGFFEKQSPYIFCKKGCSKCCENGEYPFSRLEYDFIMIGFSKLAPEVREEILKKVKRIKAAKQQSSQAAKSEEQRAGGQEGKPLIVESGKLKVESLSSHAPSPDGERICGRTERSESGLRKDGAYCGEATNAELLEQRANSRQGWDGVISTVNNEILQAQQTDKNLSTVQPFNPSTNTPPHPNPLPQGEGACHDTPQIDKNFTYECPFLINHECSVYEFRGIICRSFGLMSINPEGLSKIPFCAFEGLNYSNVVEPDTKIISTEKYKKLGENIPEPLAYNVGYKFLTSKDIEENFKIDFGEKKALIDWF